ncbi:acyl carrier protein [Kitasatospora sp. NPDC059648]|uniref:acyl carrier protein n=1 Tax=Kitasatospora sp. NPDC059648 TaxID=3346894 RepID=UPI0036A8D462
MDHITERVMTLLVDKFSMDATITPTTPFADLGLDSLVLLELSVILEREYGARVSEDDLAEAGTAAGVAALITAHSAAV